MTRSQLIFFGLVVMALGACAQAVVDEPVRRITPPDSGTAPAITIPDDPKVGPPAEDGGTAAEVDATTGAADATVDAPLDVDGGDGGTTPPPPTVTPPTLDGTIASGEYGVHVNGQNQELSIASDPTSTQWLMSWTESHLFVAVSAANIAEGVVVYIDHSPVVPSNGGTNADGSLVGFAYDGTQPSALPFRADFVAYVKNGYQEVRQTNGANGWSGPILGLVTVSSKGSVRELSIPWTAIRPAGRPASFTWLGYAASATGYAYGVMPAGNPGGFLGLSAAFKFFYKVADTTAGSGDKPFAMKLGI